VEGDTPSLFYVMPLGFADPERPDLGNIAGIFSKGPWSKEKGTNFWHEDVPDGKVNKDLSNEYARKWVQAMWNSFAARMDWARSATGNRPPVVVVNGDSTSKFVHIDTRAGAEVQLNATGTYDSESDELSYNWSLLPGFFNGQVEIKDHTKRKAQLVIPAEAAGQDLHVLLEVKDDGAGHHITTFRRVVIHVKK
jgi:hypothetical protein